MLNYLNSKKISKAELLETGMALDEVAEPELVQ
jgi:hypothetical protein